MILPNADLRCTAEAALADPYWAKTSLEVPSRKKVQACSRFSEALPAMHTNGVPLGNAQMDPRRIFDGVPLREPRTKEGGESAASSWSKSSNASSSDSPKLNEFRDKHPRERTRIPVAADKENVRPSPHRGLEKSRSSAALGLSRLAARTSHARSQSCVKDFKEIGTPQTKKQGGIRLPSLLSLGALSPMSPVKHLPPQMARPATSPITSKNKNKENQGATALRKKPSTSLEKDGDARLGTARKPLGPRKLSPPSSPVFKAPPVAKREKENVVDFGMAEKEKNKKSRVLGDCTRKNQGDKENANMGLGLGFGSRANVAGEAKPDSVQDRMREWERERQRLREMEQQRERELEEERAREREREREEDEEMRRDIERQRLLEIELDRQREYEFEMERVRAARQMEMRMGTEMQREIDAQVAREREEMERHRVYHQAYPPVTMWRASTSSTPPDTVPPTPPSPLMEGANTYNLCSSQVLTQIIEPEPSSRFYESEPRSPNASSLSILKQSLKSSIGEEVSFVKSRWLLTR